MTSTYSHCPDFIGGEWLNRAGGTPVHHPSAGNVIAECPAAVS